MNIETNIISEYLISRKFDGFVITKKENIFWATGFWGSFAVLLVTNQRKNYLVTDARYFEKAKQLAVVHDFIPLLFDKDFLEKYSNNFTGNWLVEKSISLSEFSRLKKWFPSLKLKSQNQIIENIKRRKNQEEIQKIRTAQNQTDRVLQSFGQKYLKEGVTEQEVSFKLDLALRQDGMFELAFDSIVAFGENSAVPHHSPTNRKLKFNENILIDCGSRFDKYCSDITRNFWFGEKNTFQFKKYFQKFEKLLSVQKETLDLYCKNNKAQKIDEFCRQKLGDDAQFFMHSLGHGVGTEIHELPSLTVKAKTKLKVNDVVTCEPGLYYVGEFGIRIEDLILITETKPEILSLTTKELVVIS